GRGTDGALRRGSSDREFYRRVIREQPAVEAAALVRPAHRRRRGQAAHQDLVDAVRERLREPVDPRAADVRVACEDDALTRGELTDSPELLAGGGAARDVEAHGGGPVFESLREQRALGPDPVAEHRAAQSPDRKS